MKNITLSLSPLLICVLIASGCDLAQPINQAPVNQDAPPVAHVEEPIAEPGQNEVAEDRTITVRAETELRERAQRTATPTNNPAAIITVPVRTLISTRDRLVLQQIDHAMQLFRGEHGRAPANHDEFMERIIRANNIQLPPLRPNQEYIYEGGELKIRSPG
ncbi:MAG: hypothetical protein FWG73_03600 [Planctomycetaceae bacterium]|nr:hypothetical protein [Planctomycetaceae bacterium]